MDPNINNVISQLGQYDPTPGKMPRVPAGQHTFALIDYFVTQTQQHGPSFVAQFLVVESDTLEKGTCVAKAWVPGKSNYPNQTYGDINAFLIALLGLSHPSEVPAQATKLIDLNTRPGRGLVVRGFAYEKPPKPGKTPWVDVQWTHVAPDAHVAARRAYIEANCPLYTPAAPRQAMPAPQPAPQPAPTPMAAAPAQAQPATILPPQAAPMGVQQPATPPFGGAQGNGGGGIPGF